MDSEGSDDLFMEDLKFRSLSIADFRDVVNEIIVNDAIKDGAALCFQMFYKIIGDSILKNKFDSGYSNLDVVARCIHGLSHVNKFDFRLFLNYLLSEFRTLPFEIIWWLNKNDIIYFMQYCETVKYTYLSTNLLNFIEAKRNNSFNHKEIVEDLLLELIRCTNHPRATAYKWYRCKLWILYSTEVMNCMIEEMLIKVFDDTVESYDNFLTYIQHFNKLLPVKILKSFFQNVLGRILRKCTDEFDKFGAYVYQELFTSDRTNPKLVAVYREIFFQYCTMKDIVSIIDEYEDIISWRHTLAAVGVCVKVSPSANADGKEIAETFLKQSFKGGREDPFIKCFLFIRQSCMEPEMKMDYQTWFSMALGRQSDFKSKYTTTFFKFVMSSLTKMIPYESRKFLNYQIEQPFSAPIRCNSLIHNYKKLCKSRMQELLDSTLIDMDGVMLTLLHVIEECIRTGAVSKLMATLIQNKKFTYIILQEIIKNRPQFVKIKEMLLAENYIDMKAIHNVSLYYNGDEDFFNCPPNENK
ncbi:hypothetical protein FQA39_LY11405 [Lamprigera yunnana]|nr:hypothetical protein FQA39_LY11405 [Lamprigera yunnana]